MLFQFTPQAISDLYEIWSYIAADHPEAADRVEQAIYNACKLIAQSPMAGQVRCGLPLTSCEEFTTLAAKEVEAEWLAANKDMINEKIGRQVRHQRRQRVARRSRLRLIGRPQPAPLLGQHDRVGGVPGVVPHRNRPYHHRHVFRQVRRQRRHVL